MAEGGNEFDLDATLAAMLPPVVVIGGQRYEGKALSWPEALPWAKKLQEVRAAAGEGAEERWMAFVRELATAMAFPPEVGERLVNSPVTVAMQALSFFLAQSQIVPALSRLLTSGNASPPADAAAPPA